MTCPAFTLSGRDRMGLTGRWHHHSTQGRQKWDNQAHSRHSAQTGKAPVGAVAITATPAPR